MNKSKDENVSAGERIAKVMARAGLCSRRDAEKWIAAGRVEVNGETLTTPAVKITSADSVIVDGKPLQGAEKTRLFVFHKPAGLVTTSRDEKGRKTVFDALPDNLPRLISVGRLDLNTEGLLLLTNDGGLSRYMELPSNAWVRKYRVRVHGHIDENRLADLKNGITVDGVRYGSIVAHWDRDTGAHKWISVELQEGKNREIRNVMAALGLDVSRLMRLSYGPFGLGKLERGAITEIPDSVLRKKCSDFFKGQKS